jgi:hypothetical protein
MRRSNSERRARTLDIKLRTSGMSRIRDRTLGTNKKTATRPGLSNPFVSNRIKCSTSRIRISNSSGVKSGIKTTSISNRTAGTPIIMSITKLRTPDGARPLRMTGIRRKTPSTAGVPTLNLKTKTRRPTHSTAGTLVLKMSPTIRNSNSGIPGTLTPWKL